MPATLTSVAASSLLLALLALPACAQEPAPDYLGPLAPVRPTRACTVERIVDGDTIECRGVGRIRLIGIDSPELSQGVVGRRASAALAALIPPGSAVTVEPDVAPRDRYNRVLGYVWKDSALVNWMMISQGWAVLLTYPPNVQYVEWFTTAQAAAREAARGLWASGGFDCLPLDRRRGRC